jgi:hypothetical protein
MSAQQLGIFELAGGAYVIDEDRYAGAIGAPGRRVHLRRKMRLPDDVLRPTDAGANQQIAGLGAIFEDLGMLDSDPLGGALACLLEQGTEIAGLERLATELGHDFAMARQPRGIG